MLCIEEPENGIHPSRVPNLAELLRDYAVDIHDSVRADNPLRQVVLNTHSPEVARQLPFDDLVFVERALTSQDGPVSSFSADHRDLADHGGERPGIDRAAHRSPSGSRLHRRLAGQRRARSAEARVRIGQVSRQLTWSVVADGGTDRLLVPVLQWAMHRLDPDVEILEPESRKRHGGVVDFLDAYESEVMLVFVHRDSENLSLERRLREFETVTRPNVVPVVPVQMSETWILFDGTAVAPRRCRAGRTASRTTSPWPGAPRGAD